MEDQTLQYIEDEQCEKRQIRAWWNGNNGVAAQAAFIFPLPPGEYSVNIQTEGQQSVDHIGGNTDGYWIGLIAYTNNNDDNWGIGNYTGCSISKFIATNSWRPGHNDLELNKCRFDKGQVIERDCIMSFHVVASGENPKFYMMAPKTMKADKYNYVVSYGAYSDKRMEFGSISVCCDESASEADRIYKHENTRIRSNHLISHGQSRLLPDLSQEQSSTERTVRTRPELPHVSDDESDGPSPSSPTEAERLYDLAVGLVPDALNEVLPSKEMLSKRPIDADGRSLPRSYSPERRPRTRSASPEYLGTYQGQNIYSDDIPPYAAEQLREASRLPSTALYSRKPKNTSKSFLSRLIESNKSEQSGAASEATTSRMSKAQLDEYTRIRKSLGVTKAKEYKASLG